MLEMSISISPCNLLTVCTLPTTSANLLPKSESRDASHNQNALFSLQPYLPAPGWFRIEEALRTLNMRRTRPRRPQLRQLEHHNPSTPTHPPFISSISSVAKYSTWYPGSTLIRETSLASTDYAVALPMGYGESKHVAERMLAVAANRSGVKVYILRLGQGAGPVAPDGGCWNRSEWFPSLIQTSKVMGCMPEKLMDIDWNPTDILVRIILDLAHRDHEGDQTYNLIISQNRDCKALMPAMQKQMGGRVVSLKE